MNKLIPNWAVLSLMAILLLNGCATSKNSTDENPVNMQMNPSGTPSPLNTSANPWTNVNPQIQGQIQRDRVNAAHP